MNTPAKSPFASRTIWGVIIAGLFGLLGVFGVDITADETSRIVEASGILTGTILAIYGRYRATRPLKTPKNDAPAWIVAGLLAGSLIATAPLTGCKTGGGIDWDNKHLQSALRAAAKTTLQIALNELGERVKEVRPYVPPITAGLDIVWAKADAENLPPSAIAAEVAAMLQTMDLADDIVAEIKAQFRDRLLTEPAIDPDVPASAPQAAYNANLAAAL
jgi:hypothetical protein